MCGSMSHIQVAIHHVLIRWQSSFGSRLQKDNKIISALKSTWHSTKLYLGCVLRIPRMITYSSCMRSARKHLTNNQVYCKNR